MKVFETMGSKRGKGKRGFTLIELLIVMVILAILAGVVVMAVGGIFSTAKEQAYNTIKPQIQNAVTAYQTEQQGALPPRMGGAAGNYPQVNTSGGVTINTAILDICAVVGIGELLRTIPDGVSDVGANNNFYNAAAHPGVDCTATGAGQHYIWTVDQTGNVYSVCDEDGDGSWDEMGGTSGLHETTDGYHDEVWP